LVKWSARVAATTADIVGARGIEVVEHRELLVVFDGERWSARSALVEQPLTGRRPRIGAIVGVE